VIGAVAIGLCTIGGIMQHFLYLPEDNEFLAAQWLRECPPGDTVHLIHASGAEAQADTLRRAFPVIVRTDALDRVQEGMLAFPDKGAARVTLPLTPDEFPLRYQFPVRVPDYRSQAPLLRNLWRLGFREVEIYHAGGSRVLPLPHLPHEFEGCHAGRRCFIVGNGPSLNQIDMTKLAGEIVFTANRGYLGFEHWGFTPPYWGVYDPLQIEQYGTEYEQHVPDSCIKFFPFQYWAYLRVSNGCPLFLDWPRAVSREFSTSPDRMCVGYSVVYMLLQVAAMMGCNAIVLVGLDHRYQLKKRNGLLRMIRLAGRWTARKYDDRIWYRCAEAAGREYFKRRGKQMAVPASRLWNAGDAGAATHFDAAYTAERKQFLMPRPQDAEADYRCARDWAASHGVQILNATPGSGLDVFPMVPFDSLFQ